VTERQEQTCKALRRAWREFTDKVNKMGNVSLHANVREECRGEDIVAFHFAAYTPIDEDLPK